MKVIGAGFGRTGTESTQAALETLLGGKCYHMKEVLGNPAHLDKWHAFGQAGRTGMDWRRCSRATWRASIGRCAIATAS